MKQFPEVVTTGGLTGQGFGNLLGRPRLGVLPLVLREAVQNSWDARRRASGIRLQFRVRVRNLDQRQEKEFRKIFNQQDSLEPLRSNALEKHLARPIRVLELSDFGTTGLSGATRPDLPTEGEPSRFVNFFFDFGRSHEDSGDGGTYGFGRSSFYTAGQASLVLVDSLVPGSRAPERRVMACRIGNAFEVKSGRYKGRYSGRHFWGVEKQGVAQPLTGQQATAVADRLGLPERSRADETGTTILIPWPSTDFNDGTTIAETLLHHLWPKMVAGREPTIRFVVEVDGVRFEVKDPRDVEEYRLFVQALEIARTKDPKKSARAIQTLKPIHTTGYLGVAVGVVSARPPAAMGGGDEEDVEEPTESPLNQIALMRPSELVVRYLPVSGTEQAGSSWAGVFVCDQSEFIRTAFSRAEPPAHDDWIPDRLSDKREKYVVRKTVKSLLPDSVRDALGVSIVGGGGGPDGGHSLAAVSARFSETFLSGDGQGPAKAPGNPGGGNGGKPGGTGIRISRPLPIGLEMRGARRIARFRTTVTGAAGTHATLVATPGIYAEGRLDEAPEGIAPPTVVAWIGGTARGNRCDVKLDAPKKDLEIQVAFCDEYGVTLDCVIEEEPT